MATQSSLKIGDRITDGRVVKIERRTSGAANVHVEGGERPLYVAPGKRIKITRDGPSPADRIRAEAAGRSAPGTQQGRITSARIKVGDRIAVDILSDGSATPTRRKNPHAPSAEVISNELVPGDRQRRHKITVRLRNGTTATMVVSPSQTQKIGG